MARLKILFAALTGCLLLAGCEAADDGAVYKELLTEALWIQDEASQSHYFNFTEEGILYIFPIGLSVDEVTEHHYIFEPLENKLAIEGEGYGLYDISEMNTNRMVLKEVSSSGEITLTRSREQVNLPEYKGGK